MKNSLPNSGGKQVSDTERKNAIANVVDSVRSDRANGPAGALSNSSAHPVTFGGISYPTAGHAFQAQKVMSNGLRKKIAACATPSEAKQVGQAVALRSDWEDVKFSIMVGILAAKIAQHPSIATALLATGDSPLVDNSSEDSDLVGRAWIEIRASLRESDGPVDRTAQEFLLDRPTSETP